MSKKEKEVEPSMWLLAGSVLTIGINNTPITLLKDTQISFAGVGDENTQVGFLLMTGNYEQTPYQVENELPPNKSQFRFKRDPNGRVLDIEEQLEPKQSVESFLLSLDEDDAARFKDGVALRNAAIEAKKVKDTELAAEKAKNKEASKEANKEK